MPYKSTIVFEKCSRMTWFYLRHLYPLRNPQSSLRVLSAEHMVWTGFYLLEENNTNEIRHKLFSPNSLQKHLTNNSPPPGIHRVTLSVLTVPCSRPRLYEYFTFFHSVFCQSMKNQNKKWGYPALCVISNSHRVSQTAFSKDCFRICLLLNA